MSAISDWVASVLGGRAFAPGRMEVAVDCLACDKPGHLYVNVKSGLAFCFRCGYRANLRRLIVDATGVTDTEATVLSCALLRGAAQRPLVPPDEEETRLLTLLMNVQEAVEATGAVSVPGDLVRPGNQGWSYMNRRGFTDAQMRRYHLRYSGSVQESTEPWFRHVIIPDREPGGKWRYYTTRRAEWDGFPTGGPKSYHPEGVRHSDFLFGEAELRPSRLPLFVTEGPLDMMAFNGFAVCLLGKTMSDRQVLRVAEMGRDVVVALDGDASREGMRIARRLREAGVERTGVAVVPEDPAHYAGEGWLRVLRRYAEASAIYTPDLYLRKKLRGG